MNWSRMTLCLWALLGSLTATAAVAQPVVVELFTSQGCSSCPPADALLDEVARQRHVIALAYHVDYWDDAEWQDRFSIPEAGQRQRGYVRKLSRSGTFTPQVVVSGDTSFVGSNRLSMNRALAEKRDALAVELSQAGAYLRISLPERWREPMEVYAVAYLNEATTHIVRGENAHRSLRQINIVRSFKRVGRWDGTPRVMQVPLATLAMDANAVAVLLQRPNQGAITGAAALSLR